MMPIPALLALTTTQELVKIDHDGVIRWSQTGKEANFFGANYCLPSALDFRAAGYVGADRKQLVRQDLAHFNRMGWNAIRYSFWGDWEACDAEGNLVQSDQLDLLDYTIAEADRRGIYGLLSPIVTYDARWPEMKDYPASYGFMRNFDRGELDSNPKAIAAQQNYLRQLLNHVNPYTGRKLKDEPSILFIEMVNEPWHHSRNVPQAVAYINALVDAVRDTGCTKPTFHNLSQDMGMIGPLNQSKVDGITYGWYPTGLLANQELKANYLPYVEEYTPWNPVEYPKKPKLVYEFDMADTLNGYAYPAMVRAFRGLGAQFAAMFSYDMLATAPTNIGWTTHALNMVYTPKKAASSIIAAAAMSTLPMGQVQRPYSSDRKSPLRLSYEQNLSELITDRQFLHSSSTRSAPKNLQRLNRVVGYGSSPIVHYEGSGLYFLDKVRDGVWRLEVYPDSIQIADPFQDPKINRPCFQLIHQTWPMQVRLPGLGSDFTAEAIDSGNTHRPKRTAGNEFTVRPGVYILRSRSDRGHSLPLTVGGVAIREFGCPAPEPVPLRVLPDVPAYSARGNVTVRAVVPDDTRPSSVTIAWNQNGETRQQKLRRREGFLYETSIPRSHLPIGPVDLKIEARNAAGDSEAAIATVNMLKKPVLPLLTGSDTQKLIKSGDGQVTAESGQIAINMTSRGVPENFTISHFIGERIRESGKADYRTLQLAASSATPFEIEVALVDTKGVAWGSTFKLGPKTDPLSIDLRKLKPVKWLRLPQGFPPAVTPWREAPTTPVRPAPYDQLLISVRKDRNPTASAKDAKLTIREVVLKE